MTDPRTVRAVTLNTWKNEGDLPERLSAIGDGLAALSLDIVLLQEVFVADSASLHVGELLARRLGLTLAYTPGRRKLRRWGFGEVMSEAGLAVLVRGSVERVERWELPSDEAGGERIALLAAAKVAGQAITVGNVHLSHLRGDDARRCEQLHAALDAPLWRKPAALRLIGGDFNATTGSVVLESLSNRTDLKLRSVFFSSEHLQPTHPLPPRPGRAGRAIDHLLAVSTVNEPLPGIRQAKVVMNEPSSKGVWPSDHAGVFAEIAFHPLP